MNLFSRRTNKPGVSQKSVRDLMVRLIEPVASAGESPIERAAILNLKRQGVLPFSLLVEQVALRLYLDELRNGAAAVDIGFFGANLFVPEVVKVLQERNETLWKIS
jgi:hypothetical protein